MDKAAPNAGDFAELRDEVAEVAVVGLLPDNPAMALPLIDLISAKAIFCSRVADEDARWPVRLPIAVPPALALLIAPPPAMVG
jgi:hypothetical protein